MYKKLPLNPREDFKRIFLVLILCIITIVFVLKINYYTITPIQKAVIKLFLWQMVMLTSYFIRKLIAPYVETGKALLQVLNKRNHPVVRLAFSIVYGFDLMYFVGIGIIGGLIIAFAF